MPPAPPIPAQLDAQHSPPEPASGKPRRKAAARQTGEGKRRSRPYQPRRKGSHLELRHQTYLAVLEVPKALRAKLGRRRFVQSLGTDSFATAQRRAERWLTAWRKEIASARAALGDTSGQGDDAAYFRRTLARAKDETEREAIKDIIWERAYDIGLENIDGHSDPQSVPEAGDFYSRATAIPFEDRLDEWQATTRVLAKTKSIQAGDIREFAQRFPTAEDVSKPAVKRWISSDLLLEKKCAPKTVQRKLSALRGYWRHLQSVNAAPEALEPFYGLNVAMQGGRVSREDRRRPFVPADLVRLWTAATERNDQELADLIELGQWTGARIEEICSLKVESVNLAHKVPHFVVTAGKTDAAIREVPLHPRVLPTMRRLVGKRSTGYVLADLKPTKYGDRSNAIGKRFGYLKGERRNGLGFGEQYVFHSIRKTVATLLEDAGVPENVSADIIGHDKPTMTYGLYSGGTSLPVKRAAIEKLDYPLTAKNPARAKRASAPGVAP